jgi:hypothetical protein
MDALELLKQDHQKVKELFEQAEATEQGKDQEQIFAEIKRELETHARIEESVFYPAMEKHEELKDMVLEAIEEHKQVKTLLKEMDNLVSGSEKFEPKLGLNRERGTSRGRGRRGQNLSKGAEACGSEIPR